MRIEGRESAWDGPRGRSDDTEPGGHEGVDAAHAAARTFFFPASSEDCLSIVIVRCSVILTPISPAKPRNGRRDFRGFFRAFSAENGRENTSGENEVDGVLFSNRTQTGRLRRAVLVLAVTTRREDETRKRARGDPRRRRAK